LAAGEVRRIKNLDRQDFQMVCMNPGNGMINAENDNEIKVCSAFSS
jgi:hypothetical protein